MQALNQNILGTEKISKLIFKLAVPMITAQIINLLYNVIDRVYIARIPIIGVQALTGVGLCFPLFALFGAFCSLISMGGAPRAAIFLGKQDRPSAERILGNCFAALIVLGVLLTVAVLIFGEKLLFWFGGSAETVPFGLTYLRVYTSGTIILMLTFGLNPFITAQGFTKISMLTILIGAICNIILDPLFIFVFDLGVQGAAIATILSQTISCLWTLHFLTGKQTFIVLRRENIRLDKKIILPVLALGIAPFVMQSTESLLSISFNISLQKYGGDIAVGAMTIINSVMMMVNLPTIGLVQGSVPIISYNFGAGNTARVKETFKRLITATTIMSTFFCALNLIFPQWAISLFTESPEFSRYAQWALRIYIAGGFAMGVQTACQQSFVALGQARTSLFLALLRKVILLIPLIYILPLFFENKVFAVFFAEPVADITAATITFFVFRANFERILKTEIH